MSGLMLTSRFITFLIIAFSSFTISNAAEPCSGSLCQYAGTTSDGTRLYVNYLWVVIGLSVSVGLSLLFTLYFCYRRKQNKEWQRRYVADAEAAAAMRQKQNMYAQFPIAQPQPVHQPTSQFPVAPPPPVASTSRYV